MPGYKTHVGGGILIYCFLVMLFSSWWFAKLSFVTAFEWFLCAVLGSLFPDIDTKSKGQLLLYRCVAILLLCFVIQKKLTAFIWVSLVAMIPLLVRHRGIFHSVFFVILLGFGTAFFIASWYPKLQQQLLFDATFFVAGALSHIFLDRLVSRFKRSW
jgi:membrane-bound metal-dependent hydrolase YbcI (DUF457 family)